jgi:uncharacterized protein
MSVLRSIVRHSLFAGVGLDQVLLDRVLSTRPDVGFLEVESGDYLDESPAVWRLEMLRRDYPVSLRRIGLTQGPGDDVDPDQVRRLAHLCGRVEPLLVSDDLLSLVGGGLKPGSAPAGVALDRCAARITRVQDALRRSILVGTSWRPDEPGGNMAGEAEALAAMARRTGCGLICNLTGRGAASEPDGLAYLEALPADRVDEIRLAVDDTATHGGAPAGSPAWMLYAAAIRRFGPAVTVIDGDSSPPGMDRLVTIAHAADYRLQQVVSGGPRIMAA